VATADPAIAAAMVIDVQLDTEGLAVELYGSLKIGHLDHQENQPVALAHSVHCVGSSKALARRYRQGPSKTTTTGD